MYFIYIRFKFDLLLLIQAAFL